MPPALPDMLMAGAAAPAAAGAAAGAAAAGALGLSFNCEPVKQAFVSAACA